MGRGMKRGGSDWTEAREAQLSFMWTEGHTGEAIARALGGLTRCGVIGKARRMGLAHRVSAEGRASAQYIRVSKGPRIKSPPPAQAPKVIVSEPPALGPVGDFPDGAGCRYIAGDPQSHDWQCCGAPTPHIESRWCEFHHSVVFTPTRPRNVTPEPRRFAA